MLGDVPPQADAIGPDVVVIATRIKEDRSRLSASTSVVSGADLRRRGANDLRSALALVAGVDIAPGGDGGPAAAVPEMWGFREFDAFLLVVDGVPWGGAFNPDTATLSLHDVERIEILRGAAPVMYGATSFVGVIHVVRNAPGSAGTRYTGTFGTESSFGGSGSFDLPGFAGLASRVTLDADQRGLADDRAQFSRAHFNWRGETEVGSSSQLRLNVDATTVEQSPVSPVPRQGRVLSPLVPLEANYNPRAAHVDPSRLAFTAEYSSPQSFGAWSALASYAHSTTRTERGFVTELAPDTFTAQGFRTRTTQDDVYLDVHAQITSLPVFEFVVGADYLFGDGSVGGGDYDYTVAADGSSAPRAGSVPLNSDVAIDVTRHFGGLYGYAAWQANERLRLDAGLRANIVGESRDARAGEFGSGVDQGSDSRSTTRLSGSAGAVFTVWADGPDDLKLFTSYRNTFKPAAVDFGLDAEPEILEPETGESIEVGLRGAFAERRFEFEVDVFQMDLENLVVPSTSNGLPALENAGAQRFRGIETELRARVADALTLRAAWSLHDARFLDYVRDFDGTPTQLEGNRQEMTPRDLGALGAVWAPDSGFFARADVRYTGARYLNKRNTALAPGFTSWSAGIGWRAPRWEVRLDGENLSDQRDPVAESELADASYYRLEGRRAWLSFAWSNE
jgi:outer membrane receptor protein involved in Fe transport